MSGSCHPGFTIIQNLDVDKYPENHAQSVILNAPEFRDAGTWKWVACGPPNCFPDKYTEGYSALLNNVLTDKNYFLQVGLYFTRRDTLNPFQSGNQPQSDCPDLPLPDAGNPFSPNGVGWIVYAVSPDLSARALCVPYITGHDYYTTITFTSGVWWTCAADIEIPSTYRCVQHEGSTAGTHLQTSIATSVFFENYNKEGDSTSGLPYQLVAYGARTYATNVLDPIPWASEAIWTLHSCQDASLPPKNAVVDGLVHDGRQYNDETAFFNVGYMPPYC
jgi:hypothetical protein